MAITKETKIKRIEVVGDYKAVQVATDTIIKEESVEISSKRHRHVVHPDMDISEEHAEVQAIANAAWTDDIKAAWKTFKENQKPLGT